MLVQDMMTGAVACCTPDTSLTKVARLMLEHDCGAIPVIESATDRRVVGILTARDIVVRTLADDKDPFPMTAADCMTSPPLTIMADTSVAECRRIMEQNQLGRVLVVGINERVCGIVARADLRALPPEHENRQGHQEVALSSSGSGRCKSCVTAIDGKPGGSWPSD